jgi:hypothetical protein
VPKPKLDALGVALIALVALTWLSEGAAALSGVSSGTAGKVVDLGEALVLVAMAVRLGAERRLRLMAPLALYTAWVATGLINSHAPGGSIDTALRNWLLVPALAGFLAFQGANENRARAVMVGLCALTAFEFVLSLVQLVVVDQASQDSDLIVGSFGTHQNAVIGVVTLLVACLGAAGYLIGARRGALALAAGLIFPLCSSWVVIKFTTILLPVVVLITAGVALALRLTDRRRALVAFGAGLLSSALVLGSYAVFKPQSLSALDPVNGLGNYLTYGSTAGNLARARIGGTVVANYWNAGVRSAPVPAAPRGRAFQIGSLSGGAYTALLTKPGEPMLPVVPRRPFLFQARVANASGVPQSAVPEIEWHSAHRTFLSNSVGSGVSLAAGSRRPALVLVRGFAPRSAGFAVPKIAVFGHLHKGTSIYAWGLELRAAPKVLPGHLSRLEPSNSSLSTIAGRHAPGVRPGQLPRLKPSVSRLSGRHPGTRRRPPGSQPTPLLIGALPGHLWLLKTSIRGLSGSLTRELFGFGLGAARLPPNFNPVHITPQEAATESDAGTLVIERGWIGVTVVAVIALGLAILSLWLTARSRSGQWTTAFRLAVPAAIVTMAAYGTLGAMLQNHSAALTFWIILALGVSLGSEPRARR